MKPVRSACHRFAPVVMQHAVWLLLRVTLSPVDDGIATGGTVKAVLKALKRAGTARTILAIPVSPTDTLEALRAEADDVVCLVTPEPFHAVGIHYDDFDQIEDAEVVDLLKAARQRRSHSRSELKS